MEFHTHKSILLFLALVNYFSRIVGFFILEWNTGNELKNSLDFDASSYIEKQKKPMVSIEGNIGVLSTHLNWHPEAFHQFLKF